MTPTNENCPKCGSGVEDHYHRVIDYECESWFGETKGEFHQSEKCINNILRAQLSLLQKQNAELREALKPFAALAPYWDDFSDECPFYRGDYDGETFRLTAGDLRRASTVLSQNPEPQSEGEVGDFWFCGYCEKKMEGDGFCHSDGICYCSEECAEQRDSSR